MPSIFDRRDTDGSWRTPGSGRDRVIGVGVGADELFPVSTLHQVDGNEFVGSLLARGRLGGVGRRNLKAADAVINVIEPCTVIDALTHRFSELAIVRNADACSFLLFHNIRNGRLQNSLKRLFIAGALLTRVVGCD